MTRTNDTAEADRQLHKVPLLQGLAGDVLVRVRDQAHSKAVGTGEFLFNEKDAVEAFFVMPLRATEIRLS